MASYKSALTAHTILSERYSIERVIGAGGFGITYLAKHVHFGTTVAIKEFFLSGKCVRCEDGRTVTFQDLHPELFEKYRQRFREEALTLCKLNNPHVVHVHDIFDENGTTYIVMDFVVGQTLQQLVLQRGAMPYDMAVNYIAQLCEAVEHIHAHHILHRDIKPENVIVNEHNNVVLIDFGSARSFVHDQEQSHTAMISMGYAPIEQYTTNSKKGNYTDLYAVGGVLYFLLTAQRPPAATDRMMHDELVPPCQLNPQVSEAANQTILKALRIKPEERYQNVAEFMNDLLGGDTVPPAPPAPKNNPEGDSTGIDWRVIKIFGIVLAVAFTLGVLFIGIRKANIRKHQPNNDLFYSSETISVYDDEYEEKAMEVAEDQQIPAYESIPQQPLEEFVNLGLPSGTLWQISNESGGDYNDGLYTFDQAKSRFGSQLPTKAQLGELWDSCLWRWNGSGYDVTGPNGQSITMPLTGYRESDGTLKNRDITGNYWSKDIRQEASYKSWKLYFRADHTEICSWSRKDYHAVRLVR